MTNTARPPNVAAVRLLLNRIVSTVDDEPDFDAAGDLMVRYVDDVVAGRDTGDIMSRLDPHLRQSPESSDTLSTLESLATYESDGNLPDIDELWSELATACRPVDTSAPAVSRAPSHVPRAGLLETVRQSLGNLFPGPLVAVPAMLLALLVVTSVGWWRADGRADENGVLMQTVAGATSMRFNKMGGGAWARVAYDPDDRHALVWAGGLPSVADGETYECWFARNDGERVLARALERFQGDPAWYHLETDKLVQSFDRFVMTKEPQGDVVLEVALHDPAAQQ